MKRIDFTDQELNVLAQFIDLAVKASGNGSVHAASHMLRKLENAEDVPDDPDNPVESGVWQS